MNIKIASFDIGKKNFAWYVQEIDTSLLKSINPPIKTERYNKNGTPTPGMKCFLNTMHSIGKTVTWDNVDITDGCDKKKYLDNETFHNLNDVLSDNEDVWNDVDVFIIEQQMSNPKAYNTMCLKLAQHCFSYFTIKYGRLKDIYYFPAYHKTRLLGAPKFVIREKDGKSCKMTKHQRKKWACTTCIETLINRGEVYEAEKILDIKKKDDISDCFLMIECFIFLRFFESKI